MFNQQASLQDPRFRDMDYYAGKITFVKRNDEMLFQMMNPILTGKCNKIYSFCVFDWCSNSQKAKDKQILL